MRAYAEDFDLTVCTVLFDLLCTVRSEAGATFTGLGVLVSDHPHDLPLLPLRPDGPASSGKTLAEFLSEISRDTSDLHDGFHLLSSDFRLISTSLYFAAPIVPNLGFDSNRQVGARFMTAMFGSSLDSVIATGVVSASYGVVVFQRGAEVRAAS